MFLFDNHPHHPLVLCGLSSSGSLVISPLFAAMSFLAHLTAFTSSHAEPRLVAQTGCYHDWLDSPAHIPRASTFLKVWLPRCHGHLYAQGSVAQPQVPKHVSFTFNAKHLRIVAPTTRHPTLFRTLMYWNPIVRVERQPLEAGRKDLGAALAFAHCMPWELGNDPTKIASQAWRPVPQRHRDVQHHVTSMLGRNAGFLDRQSQVRRHCLPLCPALQVQYRY